MSCSKTTPRPRSVEHPGVGNLELAKRQLVDVAGAHIRAGQRRGQPLVPTPKEAFHRARAEPVTDPLQRRGVLTITEAVIQGGVAGAEPFALRCAQVCPLSQIHTGQGAYALVFQNAPPHSGSPGSPGGLEAIGAAAYRRDRDAAARGQRRRYSSVKGTSNPA